METQQSTKPAEPSWVENIRGWKLERSDDRWFAGVAGGIAKRMQIDPLVIRGALVVITLLSFGFGVITYLLGWLFLPDARDGRIAAQDMSVDTRVRNQFIGVVLLTFAGLALLGLLGVSIGFITGPLVGFLVLGGIGLYFLFRKSDSPQDFPSDDAGASRTSESATAQTLTLPAAASSPASGDTTYVAPFTPGPSASATASDDSISATTRTATVRRTKSVGGIGFAVTAGLSLLLLAGLLVARHYDAFHMAVTPVWLMGSLVIAGLVIVIGGLMGRTSGAVGFFAVLGVLAAPFVAIFGSGPVMHPDADIVWFGSSTEVISDTSDINEGYGVVAGSLTVDISDLDTSAATGPVTVPLSVMAGELNVIVGTQDVAVIYTVQAGNVESNIPGLNLDAGGIRISEGRAGFNPDGTEPDIILDLRVTAASANLEATR